MAFKLIKNKAQSIAVKGFIATALLCVALDLCKALAIDLTAPFLMVWIMVWIIGASANSKPSA